METLLKKYKQTAIIFLLACTILAGQDNPPSFYLNKYNVEFAVKLKDYQEVEIEINKGDLGIVEHIYRENLFLDKRASSITNTSIAYEPPFNQITSIEAYTYKPELEKDSYDRIKVKDISDQQLIHDQYFDGQRAKVFSYPGVMEGAITVLEYERRIYEPRLVGSAIFQSFMPREEQTFTLTYDENVDVDILYVNCTEEDFDHQVEHKSGKYSKKWVYKNTEKLKEESSMPEFLEIAPHIIYRIKSYQYKGETIPVLRDVTDLQTWYNSFLEDVRKDHSDEISRITDSLVMGVESDHEKVERIFNWVQGHIKYIAIEDGMEGFRPRVASEVIEKRYGDCKDMSCLTISMIKQAGIPAYYTWIGTRSLPYSYEDVPSPLTDNHMIAAVKLDGELIFLDATDNGLSYPLPSSFIQGKEALVSYSPDSFRIEKVPVVASLENRISDSLYYTLDGSTLKGKGSKYFSGYYSSRMKHNLKTHSKDQRDKIYKSNLSKGSNKSRTFNYDLDIRNDGVSIGYEIEIPDYVYVNDDEIIINLNLERALSDFQIEKDREYPMVNRFKYSIGFKVVLEVPEGYEFSYIPENGKYDKEDYSFSIQYEKLSDSQVQYELEIDINTLEIQNEEFESWNKMIKLLNKNYNESIILKKQ